MDLEKIQAFREAEAQKKKEALEAERAKQNADSVASTVKTGSFLNSKASKEVKKAVTESGDKVASTVEKVQTALESGQDSVAQAINNLMLATVLTKDPKLAEAADNVASLLSSIADASDKFGKSSLNLLPVVNKELAKTISELAKSVREKQDANLAPEFDKVVEALNNLDVKPVVNVPQTEIRVDTKPITDAIKTLQKSIKPTKIDIPETDFADVIKGLGGIQKTISNLSFPVPNYVLPFKDSSGKATQVQLDADGKIPTSGGGGGEVTQDTAADLNAQVVGSVASGATDAGNPVKVGGKYNATKPTFTDGQRGDVQIDTKGNLHVTPGFANGTNLFAGLVDNADGVAVTSVGTRLAVSSRQYVFNGTTYDRMRGDTNGTLVEQRFSYSRKTADGQVKASAGFVHTVTISPTTATPTAGLLTIYDNTAESGTIIFSEWVSATAPAHTVILNVTASTGIYVGYDATLANVSCTVSYR